MEVAGLAVGTLSAVETLLNIYKAVSEIVDNVKSFQNDRAAILAKLNAERTITRNLRELLFEAPDPNHGRATLFEALDTPMQHSINLIFIEFVRNIQDYHPLDARYQLSPATATHALEAGPADSPLSVITGESVWDGPRARLRWAIWDKKRLAGIVGDFEMWNRKITQLLELNLLGRQMQMARLQQPLSAELRLQPTVAEALGISDALAAQAKAVQTLPADNGDDDTAPSHDVASSAAAEAVVDYYKRPWTDLRSARRPAPESKFEIGRFGDGIVLVDSKQYQGSAQGDAQRRSCGARLNQLVSILQNLHRLERAIPHCLCWMERVDKGAHSLLFGIPPHLEPRPVSLFDALPGTSVSAGPGLEERYAMAYELASVVDRLHSVSWVHKNLRSDNIVFYHAKEALRLRASSSSSAADRVLEKVLPPDWFLYGFEYARPVDSATSLKSDSNFERNVYRHPHRWGVPTDAFAPVHDLYALGVVLLELGMWRRATTLVHHDASRIADPFGITNSLAARARKHLGFSASSRYRNVVLRCLEGRFEPDHDVDNEAAVVAADSDTLLASRFRSSVVDELRLLAYPDRASSQRIRQGVWQGESIGVV